MRPLTHQAVRSSEHGTRPNVATAHEALQHRHVGGPYATRRTPGVHQWVGVHQRGVRLVAHWPVVVRVVRAPATRHALVHTSRAAGQPLCVVFAVGRHAITWVAHCILPRSHRLSPSIQSTPLPGSLLFVWYLVNTRDGRKECR